MMHYWWGNGWGVGAMITFAAVMLVIGAGVAAVVLSLFKKSPAESGHPGRMSTQKDAEGILNERFARGEIDEQEYLSRRATLRRNE